MRLDIMQLQAGTVIGGMTEVSRPETPRSMSPTRTGRSSRQRSSTSDGSAQSSPMIITFRAAATRAIVLSVGVSQSVTRSRPRTCSAKISRSDAPSSRRAICRSAAFRSGIASHSAAPSSSATGRTHSRSCSRRARAGIATPALEVDELARQAVADRAPEVLLDQAVRQLGQRLALVERARDPGGERVRERRESARLGDVGLRVADPDLDRREHQMRPDAPPDLRVLGDRAGLVEEADVALPLVPARRSRRARRSAGTCA